MTPKTSPARRARSAKTPAEKGDFAAPPQIVDTAPRASGNQRAVAASAVFIAVVIGGAAIYWLRPILTPLALAMFLFVMVEGFTHWLKSRVKGLPDWGALSLALASLAGVFVLSTWIIAENAGNFVSQLAGYGPRLDTLLADVAGAVGIDVPPTLNDLFDRLNPTAYIGAVAQGFQSFVSDAVFVLIYLGFLIASRAGFKDKWVSLYPRSADRADASVILKQIRNGVEKYLWVQTVTGFLIAAVSWVVMALVGLDNAFFWAFLIFVSGYIPIIGPLIGGLAPPVFALIQFDSYGPAILLLVALNALNFGVSNVILPRMQGESLNLDPVALLLSLAFWGAIWGLSGMFLSTPLTVMVMVILAQFRGSHWVAVLMSGDGRPLGNAKTEGDQSLTK